ncbi:zinc import ATP-binding ZnuC domain protein [Orientia tsutsugamushi str. UT76]|nr:zinc import ATP-binding ZnuC domain protein [Orientia tsutsugamushi str. UT76]
MTIAEFKKVSKAYSSHYQAIKDINFKIKANEITTLVGPNGAGKTTVAKLLLGLNNQLQVILLNKMVYLYHMFHKKFT